MLWRHPLERLPRSSRRMTRQSNWAQSSSTALPVQKSQLPFRASTGTYGVPAKESNVGNGQGDTMAPMRSMIPLAIETRAVEWLVVGFQFVARRESAVREPCPR